jgi:hypothetical protein
MMNPSTHDSKSESDCFDRDAAVTRSLLGWGVVAGPFYVIVSLAQAFARDGFDLSRHSLSLLANGAWGWIQITNLILTGLMVGAAAVGFLRAMRPARTAGRWLGVYGISLVLGGAFVADPMDGFPAGTPDGAAESMSFSGVMHLAAGAIGFIALAVAYVVLGRWFAARGQRRMALGSWVGGATILVGFVVGAATATTTLGVVALWIAVLTGFGWLVAASVTLYRTVPHPDRLLG